MTPAAAFLAKLQERGVTVRAEGEKLRLRPASKLTPEEIDAVRRLKPEILRLLSPPPASVSPGPVALDPVTVREVLGPHPDGRDLARLRFNVLAAVEALQQ